MKKRIPRYRNNKLKKNDYLLIVKYLAYLASVIIISIIFFSILYLAFLIKQKYDVAKPVNFAVVYKDCIKIIRYDPKYREILILNINGDTIFDTSSRLGKYPAKSLYNLSLNEKRGSELLRITLMKNLHLPIYQVIDCINLKHTDSFSSLTILKCSNSKLEDRLYIGYVLMRVGNNQIHKELKDYQVLEPDVDSDGLRISENVFNELEFDFSADLNAKDVISVEIEVPDGSYIPDYIDDIIRITGGRIVRTSGVVTGGLSDNCMITSNNKDYLKYMKTIFHCATDYSVYAKDSVYKFSKGYLEFF